MSAPMEQDPTIDSSGSHLRTPSNSSSHSRDLVFVTSNPAVTSTLGVSSNTTSFQSFSNISPVTDTCPWTGNGITQNPPDLRTPLGSQGLTGSANCPRQSQTLAVRPVHLPIGQQNEQLNNRHFEKEERMGSTNDLDISNVHDLGTSDMNITVTNPDTEGLRSWSSSRTFVRFKNGVRSCSAENNLDVLEVETDNRIANNKPLNIDNGTDEVEDMQSCHYTDNNLCVGSRPSLGSKVSHGSLSDDPNYQDFDTDDSINNLMKRNVECDASITLVKQRAQQEYNKSERPNNRQSPVVRFNSGSDDSVTQLKQLNYYLESNHNFGNDKTDSLNGKSSDVRRINSSQTTLDTCLTQSEKWERESEEKITKGCIRNQSSLDGMEQMQDSFNEPVYSFGQNFDCDEHSQDSCSEKQCSTSNTQTIPHYLDFNKYSQSVESLPNKQAPESFLTNQDSSEGLREINKSPKRMLNEEIQKSDVGNPRHKVYEKLERLNSAQHDFSYEPNFRFAENTSFPTIGDVFTPVEETCKINDFQKRRDSELPLGVDSCRDSIMPKRQTYPQSSSNNLQKKTKTWHTVTSRIPDLKQHVRFEDSELESSSNCRFNRECQTEIKEKRRPALPPRHPSSSPGYVKYVPAGVSHRPSLDGLLANDNVFRHYNKTLKDYSGWNPKETDNTVSTCT